MNYEDRIEAILMPAFPRDHRHNGHNGMTLRDYFAAKALAAVYPDCVAAGACSHPDWRVGVAIDCYAMADAMIAARKAAGNAG